MNLFVIGTDPQYTLTRLEEAGGQKVNKVGEPANYYGRNMACPGVETSGKSHLELNCKRQKLC